MSVEDKMLPYIYIDNDTVIDVSNSKKCAIADVPSDATLMIIPDQTDVVPSDSKHIYKIADEKYPDSLISISRYDNNLYQVFTHKEMIKFKDKFAYPSLLTENKNMPQSGCYVVLFQFENISIISVFNNRRHVLTRIMLVSINSHERLLSEILRVIRAALIADEFVIYTFNDISFQDYKVQKLSFDEFTNVNAAKFLSNNEIKQIIRSRWIKTEGVLLFVSISCFVVAISWYVLLYLSKSEKQNDINLLHKEKSKIATSISAESKKNYSILEETETLVDFAIYIINTIPKVFDVKEIDLERDKGTIMIVNNTGLNLSLSPYTANIVPNGYSSLQQTRINNDRSIETQVLFSKEGKKPYNTDTPDTIRSGR